MFVQSLHSVWMQWCDVVPACQHIYLFSIPPCTCSCRHHTPSACYMLWIDKSATTERTAAFYYSSWTKMTSLWCVHAMLYYAYEMATYDFLLWEFILSLVSWRLKTQLCVFICFGGGVASTFNVTNKTSDLNRSTLIGEYHFWGEIGFRMPLFRVRVGGNSNSCSGIFTRAFLAFSSLAPSSVDPLSPQRTWKCDGHTHTHIRITRANTRCSFLCKHPWLTSILLMPPTPLPP